MQFTIRRNDLASALRIAGATIERSPNLSVLECVLVEADGGMVKFTGGNLQTMIEAHAQATITTPGAACVSYATLVKLINSMDNAITFTLEGLEGKLLKITSDRSRATLLTRPADDYLPVKFCPVVGTLVFSGQDFRRMISSTAFCAAPNGHRPILQGILINPTDDGTLVYAADGFRLAQYKASCTHEGQVKPVVIPAASLNALAKLPKDDDIINIAFSQTSKTSDYVTISGPTFFATVQVLEGRYPDASSIIPKRHHKTTLIVKAETLIPALKRVLLFSSDNAYSMKIEIKDGVATLYGKSPQRGHTVELLEGAMVTGEEVISCDASFLTSCAAAFASVTGWVHLSIRDNSPLLMQAEGNPVTYVIMPMGGV